MPQSIAVLAASLMFIDTLKLAVARDRLRLHTPGHKGRLDPLDLTELTDGSFPGEAVIAAEREIAAFYGARNAIMLCGGSSQGVKSALYYAGADGVCDVNSHRSVFDGFRLAGKRAISVGRAGSVRPITLDDVRGAVTSDVGAVIITSPTYFGFCADIAAIRDYCRANGLLFIIDGAHGAHFGCSPLLPAAFAGDCDICNVSVHKTLSALTQTAVLLDNLGGAEHAALSEAAAVMGTTSPSYLLYSSIASAVSEAGSSAERYAALYEPVRALRSEYPFLENDDFTRLVLDCAALKTDAHALNAALAANGVMSELVTDRYIVFILTAADAPDTVGALRNALDAAVRSLL